MCVNSDKYKVGLKKKELKKIQVPGKIACQTSEKTGS